MEEKQISNNELAAKMEQGFAAVNANIKDIADGMAFIANNAVTKTDLKAGLGGLEKRLMARIKTVLWT